MAISDFEILFSTTPVVDFHGYYKSKKIFMTNSPGWSKNAHNISVFKFLAQKKDPFRGPKPTQ